MSDSQETPWSDNPNAPKISYHLYFGEKSSFAGTLIGVILYGTPNTPPTYVSVYPCSVCLFGYSRNDYRTVLQMYDHVI